MLPAIEFYIDVPENERLSANDRPSPFERARRTKAMRTRAAWETRVKAKRVRLAQQVGCFVEIQRPYGGRLDPNNLNPTTKALIDGMVDAGLLIDDSARYLVGPFHMLGTVSRDIARGWYRFIFRFYLLEDEPEAGAA